MSYCRDCGKEITFKRTKNERWMPCDVLTGEPHFCKEDKNRVESGIIACKYCGKPCFRNGKVMIDYTTLKAHKCKTVDIARYKKYLAKIKVRNK